MKWQPYDTVPKDGTKVDLWLRSGRRLTDERWDVENERWIGHWPEHIFSHWMPTPEPPEFAGDPCDI